MATRKPRKAYIPTTKLINPKTGQATQAYYQMMSNLSSRTLDNVNENIYSWVKACDYATDIATGNLTATYDNGNNGIGARLIFSSTSITIDGATITNADSTTRILIKNQTNTFENGIYSPVSTLTVSDNVVLIRTSDYDNNRTSSQINKGDTITVRSGDTNKQTTWIQQTFDSSAGDVVGTATITFYMSSILPNFRVVSGVLTINVSLSNGAATLTDFRDLPGRYILLTGQTNTVENGLYINLGLVDGAYPIVRPKDFASGNPIQAQLNMGCILQANSSIHTARFWYLASSNSPTNNVTIDVHTQVWSIIAIDLSAQSQYVNALPATNGGTGLSSYTQGDMLYMGSGANTTLSKLAKDTNATRYISNTGSDNAPAWAQVNVANGVTGTLPVANGGTGVTTIPSCCVWKNAATTLAANGYTKISFDSENWDIGSYFDSTTNYRYTPGVVGTYLVSVNLIYNDANIVQTTQYGLVLYKNGSAHRWFNIYQCNSVATVVVFNASLLVQLNGSTDYIEIYGFNGNAVNTVAVPTFSSATLQTLDIVRVGPSS